MPVAKGTTLVDVQYLGVPGYIAPCLLHDDRGVAVIDPGPASSLAGLESALAELNLTTADIHTLLLTHIHLDHAGATGTLVKRHPDIKVYVHERGARHMIDPSKLLASAQRLYGDKMDYLWGEFLPTPAENVTALTGGEQIAINGRNLEVLYTPGHAIHHVSFIDQTEGIAFTGDVTGMRPGGSGVAFPVTPVPDVDMEGWHASLAAIRERCPARLFLTHFGPGNDPMNHLDQMSERLARWSDRVSADIRSGREDTAAAQDFADWVRTELTSLMPAEKFGPMIREDALLSDWHGIARYWRKK